MLTSFQYEECMAEFRARFQEVADMEDFLSSLISLIDPCRLFDRKDNEAIDDEASLRNKLSRHPLYASPVGEEIVKVLTDSEREPTPSFGRYIVGRAVAEAVLSGAGREWNLEKLVDFFQCVEGVGDGLVSALDIEKRREVAKDIFEQIISDCNQRPDMDGEFSRQDDTIRSVFQLCAVSPLSRSHMILLVGKLFATHQEVAASLLGKLKSPGDVNTVLWLSECPRNSKIFLQIFSQLESCVENSQWNHSIVAPVFLYFALTLAEEMQRNPVEDEKTLLCFLKELAVCLFSRIDGVGLVLWFGEFLFPRVLRLPLPESRHPEECVLDLFFDAMREELNSNNAYPQLFDFARSLLSSDTHEKQMSFFEDTGIRKSISDASLFYMLLTALYLAPEKDARPNKLPAIELYEQQLCLGEAPPYPALGTKYPPDALYSLGTWYAASDTPVERWTRSGNLFRASVNRDMRHPFTHQARQNFYARSFHMSVGLAIADLLHGESTDVAIRLLKQILSAVKLHLLAQDTASSDEDFLGRIALHVTARLYLFSDESKKADECFNAIRSMQSFPQIASKMVEGLFLNGAELSFFESLPGFITLSSELVANQISHVKDDVWGDSRYDLSALLKWQDMLSQSLQPGVR